MVIALALVRGHWSIENNLFGARNTTFGENASRVRASDAPQNLAAIRNLAVNLLNFLRLSKPICVTLSWLYPTGLSRPPDILSVRQETAFHGITSPCGSSA